MNTDSILTWYTGKAQEKAVAALKLLQESIQAGQWIPKASRSVRATLGKFNVAIKFARAHEAFLDNCGLPGAAYSELSEDEVASRNMGRAISRSMRYGILSGVSTLSTAPLRKALLGLDVNHGMESALTRIDQYIRDFGPVGDAMDRLDATRPKPVFTSIGVSPTITKTLQDVGLDLDLSTIRVCPIRWEKVEIEGKNGKAWVWVGFLEWPDGTLHYRSRFYADGQCHACGHGIRNPFNWVPLIINGKDGTPYSLYVGRDCAERVFGVKMTGDLQLSRPLGS